MAKVEFYKVEEIINVESRQYDSNTRIPIPSRYHGKIMKLIIFKGVKKRKS